MPDSVRDPRPRRSVAHVFGCTHDGCRCGRAAWWRESLCRLGAHLGNWNDRHNATGARMAEHPRRWHVIDHIARWMYVRPDCGRRR